MTKNLLSFLAGLGLLGFSQVARAQTAGSVGIGTATPHASAVLDLSATDKGLLVPRLTSAQATAIVSPADGLLVYRTDGLQPGLWYYKAGLGWTYVNPTGADNLGNHLATQALNMNGNAISFGAALTQQLNLYNSGYGIGVQAGTLYQRSGTGFAWFRGGAYAAGQNDPGAGGTMQMVLSGAGDLGLGTTSPQGRLDVASGAVRFPAAGGTDTWFNFPGNSQNYLRGTTILADEATGSRVGIGTSTASEKLEVAGNVKISGSGNGITFADGTRQTTTAQADNLGNHTATQPLKLGSNALVGTGADIGTTVGVGVRADGGLNIGQNNNGKVAIGYLAGNVSTGARNIFIGESAGAVNAYDNGNLFIGSSSGLLLSQGSNNCFVGTYSGGYSTTGTGNTFVGHYAGLGENQGEKNTALGAGTYVAASITNATAIGAGAYVTRSNSLVLGGSYPYGNLVNVGIGTSAPDATLHVAGASSTVRMEGLAGPGTRFVTADAAGNLAATTQTSSMLGRLAAAQSGSIELTSSTYSSSGLGYAIVTFPVPFANPPAQVLVTVRSANGYDTFAATTLNVTTTGFQVTIARANNNNSGYSPLPSIDWLAIP